MHDLPVLPHGEGTLSYVEEKNLIKYRKSVNGKRLTVYASTVKECMKKMREKENEFLDQQTYEHPTELSDKVILQDSMYHWLINYKKPNLKSRSYDTIESTYMTHVKDKPIGRIAITNITSTDIQEVLNEISQNRATSTIKKAHNLFKQFFEFYYAQDPIHNPMNRVVMPKVQVVYDPSAPIVDEEELVVLSDQEMDALTNELEKPYSPGRIGYAYGSAILFIMWTFMRIGEVIALQYKDIDFDEKTIKVYKSYERVRNRSGKGDNKYYWELSDTKTKNGRRIIYMSDQAIKYLHRHLEEHYPNPTPDTFIFFSQQDNPLAAQFMNDILSKALQRAGITKHVTIHGLRHTGISYFIRHGVPNEVISKLAGHSDVSITNRIYYDVIEEQKRSAVQLP